MEEWRDVEWSKWQYQVSNTGFCRSMYYGHKWNKRIRPVKWYPTKLWYWRIHIQWKHYYIHRLVWEAFLDKWIYNEINHIDWNKNNNHVDNLEWCSRSHNLKHRYTQPWYINKRKKYNKIIITNWKIDLEFNSKEDIAKYFNKSVSSVYDFLSGYSSRIIKYDYFTIKELIKEGGK